MGGATPRFVHSERDVVVVDQSGSFVDIVDAIDLMISSTGYFSLTVLDFRQR